MIVNMAANPNDLDDLSCCAPLVEGVLGANDAEHLAQAFAALADPVRLRIFSTIAAGGSVCSCHLEGPIGKSQPTISHHTTKLAAAGLIVGEKRGRWTWWSVAPNRLDDLQRILGASTPATA